MAEMVPQQCPLAQGSRPACANMQSSAYLTHGLWSHQFMAGMPVWILEKANVESASGLCQVQALNLSSRFSVTMWSDLGCVTWLVHEVGITVLI